ncbi:Concanavalin A-like lectin/glucanases superfamily [Penicillium griseofulvum]|uniref:endo-1,3(4)-beta-glucanase n=1 Tax=Penicillium patulum TaxID=5078 RepID=A0A135LVG4_PENPA|nr:Concanavalin A-like lectin/glucanases superfamily [Penicillium griseofulvum]KXG52963.1 Concanavalin A-like lectin/glucanases superfamily [Penicillium griseofulvum]
MVRLPTLVGAATLALSNLAAAKYALSDSYDAKNFFDGFEFRTGTGSGGFAQYVDAATAEAKSLAGVRDGKVYLSVDNTTENTTGGRQSVRLISKKVWTNGVFIADIAHMPGNSCGVWPAYWTSGPDWPNSGEIDIIEGVNMQKTNIVSLHSGKDCTVTNTGSAAGSVLTDPDCDSSTSAGGCSQTTTNTQAYGDGFNAINGGVYATQWTTSAISVWFFPRGKIPADITAGAPKPPTWGTPLTRFEASGCDFASHFKSNDIIFNINLCGWAGSAWPSQCSSKAATCKEYVAKNPSAYSDAYWLINSVKVYGWSN